MTILFIAHYSGFYGANKSLLKLMVLLRDKYGVNPIVLLPSAGQMCDELDRAGIPYYVSHYYWWVNYNKGLFQKLLNVRKQLINRRRIPKICNVIQDCQIDLVYSNSVTINVGVYIAKRIGVPHIWQFRESFSQYGLSFSLPRNISVAFLKRNCTSRYILISDYLKEYYDKFLPRKKTIRIYNGISLETDQKCIVERQNTIINVCVVGLISEEKNQIDAIRALRILLEKGHSVRLHLIGSSSGSYLQRIETEIRNLDLTEQVKLYGHQDNVFSVLSSMHIGLMTSFDEAFGRTTIEYMLSGMPVIASNSGANQELVKDGLNGYIYSLGDACDLASKIETFIKNPSLIESMGKRAKEYAENNFAAEKNAEQIYNVIRDVLNK